jgi:hypothetical protein
MEVLVITPVKDSLETSRKTIEAISKANGKFQYIIFNDYSALVTRDFLEKAQSEFNYSLIHLEEITKTPSPNYKLILQTARLKALSENKPLLIIESDVIIQQTTIEELLDLSTRLKNPGLIGAVTTDVSGNFNFPYSHVKKRVKPSQKTKHSISFCCTLITVELLKAYDFSLLPHDKDWYDIYISHQSRKAGFNNYLNTDIQVLHLPHSSRPWKQLKYTHPLKYYFYKLTKRRDRI